MINNMIVPLQIIHKTEQAALLKFRPIFAGDYLIVFKDFNGTVMQGKKSQAETSSLYHFSSSRLSIHSSNL
jgi:hypothetical protein